MTSIHPISNLYCQTAGPIRIAQEESGGGGMLVVSIEEYKRQLAVAEQEIASGAEGGDFLTVARQLREGVHGIL